jgi:hypothetical protein
MVYQHHQFMSRKNKVEHWTNESGREIPTRDAKTGEGFSVTVMRTEAEKEEKFAGNVYWCIVAQKAGNRVGITSQKMARAFGHAVLTTIAFIATQDDKGNRVRLRYRHDGRNATKAFDNGETVYSVMVNFRPPTKSQKKETGRQYQADHSERVRLGMVTPAGHKKYAPTRSGETFKTHEEK